MWVLEGLVAVFAARAALLDYLPPQVDKLIGIVGGAKKSPEKKGWYTSGAYCEAVMKTTRRWQFIAVHGKTNGELLWQRWYTDCKQYAGVSQTKPPPQLPTGLSLALVLALVLALPLALTLVLALTLCSSHPHLCCIRKQVVPTPRISRARLTRARPSGR